MKRDATRIEYCTVITHVKVLQYGGAFRVT